MNWELFFAQVTLSGILLGAVAWLSKILVSQQLARDLEKFKRELAIEASRDRIRFGKLHERRAEVIEEVYKRLHYICGILRLQDTNSPDAKATADNLNERVIDVGYYFGQHGLYFSDEVKQKFTRIFVEGLPTSLLALRGIAELSRLDPILKEKFGDEHGLDFKEPFLKRLKEEMPLLQQLMHDLETEFQSILGVNR